MSSVAEIPPEAHEVRGEVARLHGRTWPAIAMCTAAGMVGRLVVRVGMSLWNGLPIDWRLEAWGALGFGLGGLVLGFVAVTQRSKRMELAATRAMLFRELCPSCAYEIRGVPLAADGCVVCPECGAAWNRAKL